MKTVRAVGGNGGDGCISLLQLWSNETAGPDGGDGGSGGHVVFEVMILKSIIIFKIILNNYFNIQCVYFLLLHIVIVNKLEV